MPVDTKELASSVMTAAYHAQGEFSATTDVGTWSPELVQEWIDYLLSDAAAHKRRIKGICTDNAGFAKLGIDRDTVNSGMYKGVPVVVTPTADFDTMEVVFAPAG